MGRRRAGQSEIVGRFDDPAAQVPAPDAVGHHPRRQRVVGRGNRTGQLQAATLVGRVRFLLFTRDDRQETSRDDRSALPVVAPDKDGRVGWRSLDDPHQLRFVERLLLLFQFGQLLSQLGQLLPDRFGKVRFGPIDIGQWSCGRQ